MDTRHEPRDFISATMITAANFEEHLEDIDKVFRLKKGTLRDALMPPENMAYLKEQLASSFSSIYDPLNQSVLNVTNDTGADEETAAVIAKKEQELKAQLAITFNHLTAQRESHIAAHLAAIESTRQKIINKDGFYAGNHALTLSAFKQNIAIALQKAAHEFFTNHEATRAAPAQFNKIFKSISYVGQYGVIRHYDHATEDFAGCSLLEIQKIISEMITACQEAKEQGILHEITTQLLAINALPGNELTAQQSLIQFNHDNLHFTNTIHTIEDDANKSERAIRKSLRDLENAAHDKLNAFDEDPVSTQQRKDLRSAILTADDAIHASREKAAHRYENNQTTRVAVEEPVKEPSFWQRHPAFKKACIGAAISLAVIGLAALVTGIVFLTAGAAAAPIAAFFAMLASKIGIGGIVGLGFAAATPITGIGAMIGALIGNNTPEAPQLSATPTSSTTFRLLPTLTKGGTQASSGTVELTSQNVVNTPDEESSVRAQAADDQVISLRRRR